MLVSVVGVAVVGVPVRSGLALSGIAEERPVMVVLVECEVISSVLVGCVPVGRVLPLPAGPVGGAVRVLRVAKAVAVSSLIIASWARPDSGVRSSRNVRFARRRGDGPGLSRSMGSG
ncbi:hypothetical protein C1J01_48060, partial [Nonomuraea aridisoli]